mgnify:FL=1
MVTTNLIVLVLYLALMIGISVWGYKRTANSDDYFVAGRSLGVWVSVGSYTSTLISAWSILGATGYFYNIGWAGYWQFSGTIATSLFAAMWFGEKIRSTGLVSLPDILSARYYSNWMRGVTGFIIFIGTMLFLTVQAMGCGVIFNQILGIPNEIGIVVGVLVFLVFTVTGGMHSVAWTDFAQAVLIFIGVILAVIIGLNQVGGFSELHYQVAAKNPQFLDPYGGGKMGLLMIINWFVIWGIGNLGTPHFMSRFLSCKDIKVVRLSQGLTAIAFASFYFIIGTIGAIAYILLPGITNPELVGPTFIAKMLPPVVAAIVMSAVVAAVMSTAASILLVGATTFVRDFYQGFSQKDVSEKQLLSMSRWVTIVISVVATILALKGISTIFWLQAHMVATMGASLGTALVAGFAWKRANREGGLASVIGGAGVTSIWFFFELQKVTGVHPVIPGTITAIVLLIAVSLATKAPPQEVIDRFFPDKKKNVAAPVGVVETN